MYDDSLQEEWGDVGERLFMRCLRQRVLLTAWYVLEKLRQYAVFHAYVVTIIKIGMEQIKKQIIELCSKEIKCAKFAEQCAQAVYITAATLEK